MIRNLKKLCVNLNFKIVVSFLVAFFMLLWLSFKPFNVLAVDPGWDQGSSNSESKVENVSSEILSSDNVSSSSMESVASSSQEQTDVSSSQNNVEQDSVVGNQNENQTIISESSSFSNIDSKIDSSVSSSNNKLSSSIRVKTYTKSELVDYLDKLYKSRLNAVNDANDQRILENNNKGANELLSSYKKILKNIRSGKVTKQERSKLVASQKASLQKALSTRLNSLYDEYNRNVDGIKYDLNAIDNTHENDSKVAQLSSRLVALDYRLSEDSKKAYQHYDQEVVKLNRSVSKQSVKSKKQQKADAKNAYQLNLKAVDAIDPDLLKTQNNNRLNLVTEKYNHIRFLINDGSISTVENIDKMFSVD